MTVKTETTRARRKLEATLRACVRLLAKPGTTEKDMRGAIEHLLARVGPGVDSDDKPLPDMLAELVRRGEYVAHDGYPSQSMADSDIHGGFAGASPVEGRSLRLAAPSDEEARRKREPVRPDDWAETERDVAADALRELVTNIDAAATFMGDADTTRRFLLSIQGRQRNPEAADEPDKCGLCEAVVTKVGNDRIRSGYCLACYTAWRDAGSPRDPVERSQFERDRLAKKNARLHVDPTAPAVCAYAHVCCSDDVRRSAEHRHWRSSAECADCAEVRAAKAS